METSQRDVLRGALDALTHDGSLAPVVRIDIGDSWQRSLDSGLAPDRFYVPRSDSVEPDSPLARAARPIFRTLGAELANAGLSLILADDHGQVLHRHVTDKALMSGLDEILLAPGFVYSERGVGTNGIGTALAQHAPTFVQGAEHFFEDLTTWACAAAPVIDPCTGRMLGVLDLTCRERDASPLMLPLVRRAAAEISQRLFDNSEPMERAALRSFLQQHGKTKALAFVSQGRVIANANADEFISSADEPTLWFAAAQTLERRQPQTMPVTLSSGRSIRLRCEPVADGNTLIGALVRIGVVGEGRGAPRAKESATFGWDSLTATERSVVSLASRGMTNRQIGNELFMAHRTVSSHLYRIFPKLGVKSRVELARFALERGLIDDGNAP
jgi:transcriptional regulator of acetoin/glycerol metabolism/DNA-binding CsgD family transcriptional regulator